jgi:FkbM family methyltransferase
MFHGGAGVARMKLGGLVNPQRYRRCRAIFRRPWLARLALAAGWPRSWEWQLQNGDRLRVPDARAARPLVDWLLESAPDPFPVSAESGCLVFQHGPWRIGLRPDAADFEMFQELLVRDVYRLGRFGAPLGTVVDLGAHVGLFALQAAAQAERVIGVEAAADNAAVAEQNIRRNGLSDRVQLHCAAITAGGQSSVTLFRSRRTYGHSLKASYAARWGEPIHEEVPALGLAELFQQAQIDRCGLLKCDLEGAEYDVFQAAPPELLRRIERLVIEVHRLTPRLEDERAARLVSQLRDAGLAVTLEPVQDARGQPLPWLLLTATR